MSDKGTGFCYHHFMNKYFVAFAIAGLLAAGCNKTEKVTEVTTPTSPTEQSTNAPVAQTTPDSKESAKPSTPKPVQTPSTYTWAQVNSANSPSNCWTVIGLGVYNLTSFIDKHPGGTKGISNLCGKDGTDAFTRQHGGQAKAEAALASLKIGALAR